MVIGLALIGVMFVLLAVWVIRQTRVDLEALAPLERMGDRDWRKSDPASQRRSLDEARPEGAQPLQSEPHRPRVDTEFEQSDRPIQSFDDLTSSDQEGADPTPTGSAAPDLDGEEPTSDGVDSELQLDAGVEAEGEESEDSEATDADAAEAAEAAEADAAETDANSDADSDDQPDADSDAESDSDTTQSVEQ
jgi:hypothetical protein